MATKTLSASALLTFAAVSAMSQAERIEHFAERDKTLRRAFSELGKLYAAISLGLTGRQSIFGVLSKAGVRKGTISNASYAADAFALVKTNHLTEEQYDRLTFQDCVHLRKCRALGIAKLKEILALKDPSDELECYAEHGIGIADLKAREEMKAAIEATAKAEAEKAALAAATAPADPVDPVETPADPAPVETPAPVEPDAPTNIVPMPTTAPVAETPSPAPVEAAPVETPVESELDKIARGMKLCDELEAIMNTVENPLPLIQRFRVLLGQTPDGMPKKVSKAA